MKFTMIVNDNEEFNELIRDIKYSVPVDTLLYSSRNLIVRISHTDKAVIIKNREEIRELNTMDFEELDLKFKFAFEGKEFEEAVTGKNLVLSDLHLHVRGRNALDIIAEKFI